MTMPTVSKGIADKIIAGDGYYPGDDIRVIKIVEYTDMGGKLAYGLIYEGNHPDMYAASPYIRNPKTIWEAQH
jgi:hypothetical protein